MREASRCLLHRTDEIQSLYRKWPHYWNRLKGLSWHMRLLRVELAALAGPHDLDSIRYCSRPVEPLPEGIANEGLRHRVVPASPRVDFSQQLLPLADWYTPLEYS
jgi:hypothetical protein